MSMDRRYQSALRGKEPSAAWRRRTLEAMGFAVKSLGEPVRLRAGVYTLTATQAVLAD